MGENHHAEEERESAYVPVTPGRPDPSHRSGAGVRPGKIPSWRVERAITRYQTSPSQGTMRQAGPSTRSARRPMMTQGKRAWLCFWSRIIMRETYPIGRSSQASIAATVRAGTPT